MLNLTGLMTLVTEAKFADPIADVRREIDTLSILFPWTDSDPTLVLMLPCLTMYTVSVRTIVLGKIIKPRSV